MSVVPICLETVALEPSEYFSVRDMNFVEDPEYSSSQEQLPANVPSNGIPKRLVFGRVNRFNSMDSRQYLFCLLPKSELCNNLSLMHKVNSIGKLDIMWTSAIGTKGRLQTPQLERVVGGESVLVMLTFFKNKFIIKNEFDFYQVPKVGSLKLDVEVIPSQVDLKSKFKVQFSVTNCR